MERQTIISIAGSVLFVILILLIIYFTVWYEQVPVDSLADEFCTCSQNANPAKLTYSKEDFEYAADLNACFAEQFKSYSDELNDSEKEYYISEIKKEVTTRCPEALSNVFNR